MKNKKLLKSVLIGALIFLLGISTSFAAIYLFPKLISTSITKIEKDVTITDDGISDAVNKIYDSVVIVSTYKNDSLYSSGSGFIYKVDENTTYIITNHHVIESGENFKVTYTSGDMVEASLIGSDKYSDIAVLKVKTKENYSAALIASSKNTNPGDTAFTVGAPLDNVYSWTITRGIISGKERLVEISLSSSNTADYVTNVIQTDAAVNSGNSGGPLCNSNGEVIGVISAKISMTGVEGMGFAIPIETAKDSADKIINNETIKYPYLGISMLNISDVKSYYGYSSYASDTSLESGVVVIEIEKNSCASSAGIKSGDIITKINDVSISNIAYLRYELYKHEVGDTITITYERNGKLNTAKVKLSSSNEIL